MKHDLLKRAALMALLLAVGLPAGAAETITVVGTRSAGQMYEELHRQTSIDHYCASINHSQPWCPQYEGGVGEPGTPNYGPSDQPCSGTDNVTPHCSCGSSAPRKVYDASNGKFHCRAKPADGALRGCVGDQLQLRSGQVEVRDDPVRRQRQGRREADQGLRGGRRLWELVVDLHGELRQHVRVGDRELPSIPPHGASQPAAV